MAVIDWDLQAVLGALAARVTPLELEAADCDPKLVRLARQIAAVRSRIAEVKPRIANLEAWACYLQGMQALPAGVEPAEPKRSNWDPAAVEFGREVADLKARFEACTLELRDRNVDEALIHELEGHIRELESRIWHLGVQASELRERYQKAAAMGRNWGTIFTEPMCPFPNADRMVHPRGGG
jgi:predicted nuclease with TOPRIM domain